MVRLLVPVILAFLGTGGGIGAGLMLQQGAFGAPQTQCPDPASPSPEAAPAPGGKASEFAKLNNQFVIPVVERDLVRSLVVLSLSVETGPGTRDAVYELEPKLRDAFLQILFDHANIGGFDGEFTRAGNLKTLRRNLRDAATDIIGRQVKGILITDIARQDI